VPRSAMEGPFQERSLPAPEPGTSPPQAVPVQPPPALTAQTRPSNPAVVALIGSAGEYVGAGELEKAAAAYERALRIDPHNPGIWHDLAVIRYRQQHYQQAESLAAKSNGFSAPGDDSLRAQNWRLIAQSRRALGDSVGADAAEAQAVVLERSR
jgi:predicted Zn-dependent protease